MILSLSSDKSVDLSTSVPFYNEIVLCVDATFMTDVGSSAVLLVMENKTVL